MEVVTLQVSAQQMADCCLLLSEANQERREKAIILIDFYYFLYIEIKGKVKKAWIPHWVLLASGLPLKGKKSQVMIHTEARAWRSPREINAVILQQERLLDPWWSCWVWSALREAVAFWWGTVSVKREWWKICETVAVADVGKDFEEWVVAELKRNKSRRMTLAYNFWQLLQCIITSI